MFLTYIRFILLRRSIVPHIWTFLTSFRHDPEVGREAVHDDKTLSRQQRPHRYIYLYLSLRSKYLLETKNAQFVRWLRARSQFLGIMNLAHFRYIETLWICASGNEGKHLPLSAYYLRRRCGNSAEPRGDLFANCITCSVMHRKSTDSDSLGNHSGCHSGILYQGPRCASFFSERSLWDLSPQNPRLLLASNNRWYIASSTLIYARSWPSGRIPASIGQLPALSQLLLQKNRLSGESLHRDYGQHQYSEGKIWSGLTSVEVVYSLKKFGILMKWYLIGAYSIVHAVSTSWYCILPVRHSRSQLHNVNMGYDEKYFMRFRFDSTNENSPY